jgi:hypothetical protein
MSLTSFGGEHRSGGCPSRRLSAVASVCAFSRSCFEAHPTTVAASMLASISLRIQTILSRVPHEGPDLQIKL